MYKSASLAVLTLASQVACWGGLGHRTVGYLAQKRFTKEGAELFETLIRPTTSFDISDAAVWADSIRHNRGYTEGWHFIGKSRKPSPGRSRSDPFIDAKDSPPEQCNLNYARDCKQTQGCVISAISNQVNLAHHGPSPTDPAKYSQTSLLLDSNTNQHTQNEALKYLLHFIGDIHQPLHTEDLSRGGNDIPVSFDGHHTQRLNLHSVWDSAIPRKLNGLSFDAHATEEKPAAAIWADKLSKRIEAGELSVDDSECTNLSDPNECGISWATETNVLVCAYVLAPGVDWVKENDLGGEYYEGAVPLVEVQIARAGVRLAAWVNAIAAAGNAALKQDL